jgi:pimeloyl-ACP methyl ester carboxylesterase
VEALSEEKTRGQRASEAEGDQHSGDTGESYGFARASISEVARTSAYDRANLGRSDPAAGPRGLSDRVGDFEALRQAARIPGPYVLVGTSGGGYISAGYACEHADEVAGMVFVPAVPSTRERGYDVCTG